MNKKLLSFALATLLFVGITVIANATNIPTATEPKNYPTVWTEQVYNGSGASITSGYIVAWDFDTSDAVDNNYDDMCPWVKLNATDEGVWQAGVVPYGQNIANTSTGAIIIRGPAYVLNGAATTIDTLVASDASGKCSPFDGGANDESTIGVAIKVTSLAAGAPDGGASGAAGWSLIYVNPVAYDEN